MFQGSQKDFMGVLWGLRDVPGGSRSVLKVFKEIQGPYGEVLGRGMKIQEGLEAFYRCSRAVLGCSMGFL